MFSNNDPDAIEDRVKILVAGFIVLAVGAAVIYFFSVSFEPLHTGFDTGFLVGKGGGEGVGDPYF